MTPENQKSLIEKFPKIFDQDFYFETGDGWYDLIYSLCSCIDRYVEDYNKSLKDFAKEGTEPLSVKASQVKSKFAGLRFYTNSYGHDEINAMIALAETHSYKVCETCGGRGSRKGTSWIFTMCDPCWASFEEKRKSGK